MGQKPHVLVVVSDDDFLVFEDVERLVRTHRVDVLTIGRRIDAGRVEAMPLTFGQDHWLRSKHWQKLLQKHVRVLVCDMPDTQVTRGGGRLQRLFGVPSYNGCSAGNWMMHIDDFGRAYPCFSLGESDENWAIAGSMPIIEQWKAVRGLRGKVPTGALCVGNH